MTTKTCPYCGRLFNRDSLQCKCDQWINNEVFKRLCADDVNLIKGKGLTTATPTLIAASYIRTMMKGHDLEQSLQKELEPGKLYEKQQFNILLFSSFCFLQAARTLRMKQGCEHTIEAVLHDTLIKWSARLFNKRYQHARSWDVLTEGTVLFDKLQAILGGLGTDASSQLEASNAFAFAVLGDESPLSLRGVSLYTHLMVILTVGFEHEEFRKTFLVEEEDLEWVAGYIEHRNRFETQI